MDREQLGGLIRDLEALRGALEADEERGARSHPGWLRSVLASFPDLLTVYDLDGRILYVNRATDAGPAPEELVGTHAQEHLPEAHRAAFLAAFERAIGRRETQLVELTTDDQRSWSTRLIPIERDGVVAEVLAIGSDTTARLATRQTLRLRDEQLRLALDASDMGQWRWSVLGDEVTWDATAKRIFDWPADQREITYADYLGRVHPEDVDRVRQHVETAVTTGSYPTLEHRIVLPDGRERWILNRAKVLMNGAGRAVELIGGVLDITDQKRSEKAAHRAQKLEAIGQLAGGIAHDFNNLLVAIMGNLELAQRRTDSETRDRLLEEAMHASKRAADLTRQLLAFGRRTQMQQATLDLNRMLSDNEQLFRRLFPESIELSFRYADSLPPILGDQAQLERIVVNLSVNARDAMPLGGSLLLGTESVVIEEDGDPELAPGRYVRLFVTDSGEGMSAEVVEHIFEPFFSTKAAGSGLGLATVYGITQQHGGVVRARSQLGGGSTVEVYLPVAEGTMDSEPSPLKDPIRGGDETILVAEDEAPVLDVVSRVLERAGYRVLAATDGATALELFERERDDIDAVLLDSVMPGKSGAEVAALMREIKPDVAVILSSGYSDMLTAGPSVTMGEVFLSKPYTPDTLLLTVRRALDRIDER